MYTPQASVEVVSLDRYIPWKMEFKMVEPRFGGKMLILSKRRLHTVYGGQIRCRLLAFLLSLSFPLGWLAGDTDSLSSRQRVTDAVLVLCGDKLHIAFGLKCYKSFVII